MDSELLNTCSGQFGKIVTRLEDELDDPQACRPELAPAFYVLDRLDSDIVDRFLQEWPDGNWSAGEISIEYAGTIAFLIKLHRKYPNSYKDGVKEINNIVQYMKDGQHTDGFLPNQHSAALWGLVVHGEETDAIDRGVSYLMHDLVKDGRQRDLYSEIPYGILSLMERDYEEHKQLIIDLGAELDDLIQDAFGTESESWLNEAPTIHALEKIPNQNFGSVSDLEDDLWSKMANLKWDRDFDDKTWFWTWLGEALVGMLALNHGPKTSKFHSEWASKLKHQKLRRVRADFVSTLPTTSLETRRHEIYEAAKELVENSNSSLRISSQFVDILHDDIIDLIEDGEVNVRILARRDKPAKGERSKMKEAVMQELIRRGDSENVRGDRLLHSRIVISDRDDLLVSSADLTRDQLYDEYNAGIRTRDPEAIEAAIEYFDTIWRNATSLDTSDIQ